MPRLGRKLRGWVSTRAGVIVAGYKTKFAVDPGLEDVIVPIANAHMNALGRRVTSSIYITHDNRQARALPNSLRYLSEGDGLERRMLPTYTI